MPAIQKDPYPIVPFNVPARARARVPGSKSVTNRALAIGALCGKGVSITGGLKSRDTEIMQRALIALGRTFEPLEDDSMTAEEAREIYASGTNIDLQPSRDGSLFPNHKGVTLHVGNAGTAARFLTALLCLQPEGEFTVDGDEAMYERPMKGLTDALASLGAEFTFFKTPGCIPFAVKTHGVTGSRVTVDASESSQILSALLIMAAGVGRPFEVELRGRTVSEPFVEMTVRMLAEFHAKVTSTGTGKYVITGPVQISPHSYVIEADATAASYFLSLPVAAGGTSTVDDLGRCKLQGDLAYTDVLQTVGVACGKQTRKGEGNGKIVDYVAKLRSAKPRAAVANFNAFSDTFLTLAALTPLLEGTTRITGLAHTRKQETDRVAAMAKELRKLGQTVIEEADALEIRPDLDALKHVALEARSVSPSGCVEIDTYRDHRIAMSFAILGCHDLLGDGRPWLALRDPMCCRKTFPNFYDVLEKARQDSVDAAFVTVAIDGGAATGKSSTARGLARKLGYMHVDTGSHYRALTLLFLNHRVQSDDEKSIAALLAKSPLETQVVKGDSDAKIVVDGKVPADADLRSDAVNAAVSLYAAIPAVRAALKDYQRSQRDIAKQNGYRGLVMEGRDIGSVIFPDAELKIFLEADEATRAKRRAGQGQSDSVAERDKRDSTRKTAPLVCPSGAVRLDNSHLTLDQVIDKIAEKVAGLERA
jgi:3-phosphoshikimate 1-carboxyvinyltransferase